VAEAGRGVYVDVNDAAPAKVSLKLASN